MALTPSTMLDLGTPAPAFNLPSVNGKHVSLNDFKNINGLLVLFICNHCPYVIHIKEALIAYANDYAAKGIAVVGINSNDTQSHPDDSFEKMKLEGYPFPYLFDETQEAAKAYRAACTPDLYLFDNDLKLVYRGQFDSSRPNRPSRPSANAVATGADLRAATDALLAGKQPVENQIPSMGCNIKWKEGNAPEYYG